MERFFYLTKDEKFRTLKLLQIRETLTYNFLWQ